MSIDRDSIFREPEPYSIKGETDAAVVDLQDKQTLDRFLHLIDSADMRALLHQADNLAEVGAIESKLDFMRGAIAYERQRRARPEAHELEQIIAI